jgi:hypothetical protein
MDHHRPNRSFVSYIDRSREYYAAQGYIRSYAWSHYGDVPFTLLRKPLSECRVGLVTTTGRTPASLSTIIPYIFSASFRKGLNKSIGMGKTVVELFSAAIWFKVWR